MARERRLRTLWVRFARASPLLSRRFQRASVSLSRTEFMRMRLVRFVAIILREIDPTTMYQSGRLRRAARRVAFSYPPETREGKEGSNHAPEGRGPRCRRRAQSLALCAIAENHTRCTCAAEPLVYRTEPEQRQMKYFRTPYPKSRYLTLSHTWIRATLGPRCRHGRCAVKPTPPGLDLFFLSTSTPSSYFGIERTVGVPGACSDETSAFVLRHLGTSDRIRPCVRGRSMTLLQHFDVPLTVP